MTTEQRNERNRKRRERRVEKNKVPGDLNAPIASQAEDEFVLEDDDENSDRLHRGIWNKNVEGLFVGTTNNQDGVLNNGEPAKVEGDGNVVSSIFQLDQSTHDITNPGYEDDVLNNGEPVDVVGDGNVASSISLLDENTHDITTADCEGVVDESAAADDQNVSLGERRRQNARAWRAALSPEQRVLINKRRRDSYATKRLFRTP